MLKFAKNYVQCINMFVHIQVKGRGFVMGIDSSHAPLAQNALNPNKMKYESC